MVAKQPESAIRIHRRQREGLLETSARSLATSGPRARCECYAVLSRISEPTPTAPLCDFHGGVR
jgi:hypothetical protein